VYIAKKSKFFECYTLPVLSSQLEIYLGFKVHARCRNAPIPKSFCVIVRTVYTTTQKLLGDGCITTACKP